MRFLASDPDIATIVSRIKSGDLDLQPDFQRGDVWSDTQKQKLIDSVLRDWHVPPIHVVELPESGRQEVLDGQQRLTAIRDFVDGLIAVNGDTEPRDQAIQALHGLKYADLPPSARRRFDKFTIRVFRITDYEPSEPGELFFRLNQSTRLTAAEQRNAFFGPARQQIRSIVAQLADRGVDKHSIGFSNSRMAYDDVIARLCCSLEEGSLTARLSAAFLAERYRRSDGFGLDVLGMVDESVVRFTGGLSNAATPLKLNKATFFSWLWFFAQAPEQWIREQGDHGVASFIDFFEEGRSMISYPGSGSPPGLFKGFALPNGILENLLELYVDRASSRVTDALSLLGRDVALWAFLAALGQRRHWGSLESSWRVKALRQSLADLANRPAKPSRSIAIEFVVDLYHKHRWDRCL